MNKLPNEILNDIFILLPIAKKQECISVCKRWSHIIRNRSFLHIVYISTLEHPDPYYRFARLVQKNLILATQVHGFIFNCRLISKFNIWFFLRLFPNITTVKSLGYTIDSEEINGAMYEIDHKLQYIEGYFGVGLLKSVLKYPTSLISLILDTPFEHYILNKTIIPLLKNAPLLSHLCLTNSTISFTQCDAIHDNATSLKSLGFRQYDYLLPYNKEMNGSNPARSIKTIHIKGMDSHSRGRIECYHYIGKKYPNLEQFDQNLDLLTIEHIRFDYLYAQCFSFIIQKRIRHLSLVCSPDETEFNSVLLLLNVCHIQTLKLYYANTFHLVNLSESKQNTSIEKLEICDAHRAIKTGNWMKKMISLKTLILGHRGGRPQSLDVITLFKSCPETVEIVSLKSPMIYFDNNNKHVFPNIKELYLDYPQLYLFESFVKTSLPNLHKLKLHLKINKFLVSGNSLKLDLLGRHFTSININFFVSRDLCLKLVTDKKTSFFGEQPSRTDYSILGEELIEIPEFKTPTKFFTLICASVKELYYNDKLVLF